VASLLAQGGYACFVGCEWLIDLSRLPIRRRVSKQAHSQQRVLATSVLSVAH
jgi:hypothetical protein